MTNKEALECASTLGMETIVLKRQLTWTGHIVRAIAIVTITTRTSPCSTTHDQMLRNIVTKVCEYLRYQTHAQFRDRSNSQFCRSSGIWITEKRALCQPSLSEKE